MGALALVPLLVVERGVVSSDTKAYLYLDPSRFLSQVSSMWLPTVALGTVTHQYIGYLFPMGPYYALSAAAHVPTWIAQRVWLGAILFAAGAGILHLCKVLSLHGPGRMAAALAFMCSPYILQYSGRISVILLPWASLPWLTALTIQALRAHATRGDGRAMSGNGDGRAVSGRSRGRSRTRSRWREPALFALVVGATSGINASSVLYVVLAPCLWLVWAVAVEREATWRQAASVLAKLGALSVLVSAWWIVGLVIEAGFGVDILRYTESVKATSSTSTPAEVLRGLGYWYFYGSGRLGPWTQSVVLYTKWLWLVALSFFVPAVAFLAGVLVRWRHRGYFVVLVVVGVVLSVGAYPYTHPSPFGGVLKAFMSDTTAGLAMRSTDRATPLALLGLAMLLGAGVSAAWRRASWAGWTAGVVACGLVLANNPALFNGDAAIVSGLTQPPSLPHYELAALHHLNATHRGTRVLAIPGNPFAAYTWGDTNDTPQPAVLTRPFVTREQQVMGSMATADALYALDAPIQTSIESWAALAPMARLLSSGNVMVEYDQRSALYGVPQAVTLARSLAHTPRGLFGPRTFGAPGQRVQKPTVDAQLLALPARPAPPSPIALYSVGAPRPIARAESNRGAVIVAGDATGLDTLAAQGLLDTKSALYYSGTLDAHPARLRSLAARGATLVVTDSNRKQGFRWNGLSANAGATETARSTGATRTPSDAPIDLFPGNPKGSRTVATYIGAADVTSSSYGNPVSYDPEDRAYSAIDDNLRTAWETGTFVSNVDGQWWQVAFGHRVTTDRVTLVQPLFGTRRRTITKVTLTFTGRHAVTARLGAASRRRRGQVLRFSQRTFRTLRVTIDATNNAKGTPVGFAEVRVPGQHVVEVDQLPTDLLTELGTSSLRNRLVVSMTRRRVSPYSTARTDPQMTLDRAFTLPTARTFSLTGTATLSPFLRDDQVDALVGVPGATGAGVVATSSSRLTGALADTAAAAADGNPQTAWQSGFGARDVVGAWLKYALPAPLTVGHMTLTVVADRRHSVPAALRISASTPATGHTASRDVALPRILRSTVPGTTATVHLAFAPVTGRRIRITFTKVHEKRGTLAGGTRTEILPLAIAGVGIPGLRVPPPPALLPGTCQKNLLRIDGHPVAVRVVGPTATALADGQVSLVPCGADAHGIRLGAGHHVVESTLATAPSGTTPSCATGGGCVGPGGSAGWNVDELTLSSAPGGGPGRTLRGTPLRTPAGTRTLPAPVPGPSPSVRAHAGSATTWTLHVAHARGPFELVLGESINTGWRAVAHPLPGAPPGAHDVTLGAPALVDAVANGWPVTAADLHALGARAGRPAGFTVTLTWTPQRWAWAGIVISSVACAGCLLLVLLPVRRRRRTADPADVPTLALPFGDHRARPPWWAIALGAIATGALAAAISQPLAGVGVAIAVGSGLAVRHLRILGAAAAVGLVLAAGAVVVVGQVLHPAPGGGNWPAAYHGAASIAAIAVAFFGADAVVDYGRRLGRRPSG